MSGLAAIKKRLGVKNLREANRAPNYFYQYVFGFTALTTGSSADVFQKITAAASFVITQITGVVWDTSTLATPGYSGAAPYGDLLPLTVRWIANDGASQNNPVAWNATVGTAQHPFYPMFNPAWGGGSNVVLTVANNTGKTITGSVVFSGYHLSEAR